MTLAQGTRLGPYEILAPVGAGGMGEVLRQSVEGNSLAVPAMDRDPLLSKIRNTPELAEIRVLAIEKQKQLAARRGGH